MYIVSRTNATGSEGLAQVDARKWHYAVLASLQVYGPGSARTRTPCRPEDGANKNPETSAHQKTRCYSMGQSTSHRKRTDIQRSHPPRWTSRE